MYVFLCGGVYRYMYLREYRGSADDRECVLCVDEGTYVDRLVHVRVEVKFCGVWSGAVCCLGRIS